MSLVSLADKLNAGASTLSVGGVKISLPTLSVSSMSAEPNSIGSYLGSSGSIVQTLTAGARGIYCLGAVLTDPTMMLNVLKSCMSFLGAAAITFINDVYRVCMDKLNNILTTVYGIVNTYFKAIKSLIQAFHAVGDMIKNLIDWWKNRRKSKLDDFFKREGCDMVVASILKCMMYKLLTPYMDKLKTKIYDKVNDFSNNVVNNINDATAGTTAMADYVSNQSFFVTKFTEQVNSFL